MFLEPTTVGTSTLPVYDDISGRARLPCRGLRPHAGAGRDAQRETVHAEVRAGEHVIWMHLPSSGYLGSATAKM